MIKRVDKRLQAVQCLTGNKIKIIACITMLIDHFSKIFLESIMNDKLFPLYLAGGMSTEQFYGIDAFQKNILNGIGTIAFPLFCLLLSEGFFYTKNRKRYIGGMLAFALISEVPWCCTWTRPRPTSMWTSCRWQRSRAGASQRGYQ